MKVVKVLYDSCDSWTAKTRRLETLAKDDVAAAKFISEKSGLPQEVVLEGLRDRGKQYGKVAPYWVVEEVQVFE